ncbi:MAG: hypothetical protein ACOYJL_03330 [Tractidigestivibacter sp.]|uniref:hypothetical protein n=1 Tax=Tractidigestivibacter sp. TaxID=2847320 RepID=UPI003D919EC4
MNIKENLYKHLVHSTGEILAKAEGYQYISFDIFDTLLMRTTGSPTTVFEEIGKREEWTTPAEYVQLRTRAEEMARRGNAKEIHLADIYSEMIKLDPKVSSRVDSLMTEELAVERKVLRRRNDVGEIYDKLKDSHTVLLISDMYLGKQFITNVLASAGYDIENVPVFISSEFMATKMTGELFQIAVRECSIPKPSQLLHIGDSFLPDYHGARKAGVHPFLINRNGENSSVRIN